MYYAYLLYIQCTLVSRMSSGPEIRWWSDQDHVLVLNAVEMKIRRKQKFTTPSSTPTDTEDTIRRQGESEPTPVDEDKGGRTKIDLGEDQDERMDYEYRWDAENEVITFGDISGDVEDEYNITAHRGRSDVSPWGVARSQGTTEG